MIKSMKVETKTGDHSETLAIYLPSNATPLGDNDTHGAIGEPAELYAVKLREADLVGVVGVPAAELKDEQLQRTCSLPEAQADVVVLRGCPLLRDIGCLAKLEQMQALDVSGCPNIDAASLATAMSSLL